VRLRLALTRRCPAFATLGRDHISPNLFAGDSPPQNNGDINMPTVVAKPPIPTGVISRPEIQTITFSLDSFRITDTRSRHEDTDYVSFTLLVRDANGQGTP